MNKIINKSEFLFFILVVLLNLSPVLSTNYFCTLDGGSHANNAHIIKTLLTSSHSIYSDVYKINPELVPNWSGHFVLAFLSLFFANYVSEKILVCSILILIPFFFRKIVKLIAPDNAVMCYLIFPFTHYVLLYLGFFNFTIGILFFFITVYFYLKHSLNFKWQHYIILFLLSGALYFSHLFAFVVTIFYLALHSFFVALFDSENTFWYRLRKKTLPVLLCSLPFLLLTINYFANRPPKPPSQVSFLPAERIWVMIRDGYVFSIDNIAERPFARLFFFVLIVLFFVVLIKGIIFFFNNPDKKKMVCLFFKKPVSSFLVLVIFLLSMTFVFPDGDGYGGFITLRFIYFAVLFMLLFSLELSYSGKNFNILLLFIVGFSYFNLTDFRTNQIMWTNNERHQLEKAFEKIHTNSSLLTFRLQKNDNWFLGHFMEYAGADKDILILNNYEAAEKYFPVIYLENKTAKYTAGEFNLFMGQTLQGTNDTIKKKIDYVLIYGLKNEDTEYTQMVKSIGNEYNLVYDSPRVNLFKKQ